MSSLYLAADGWLNAKLTEEPIRAGFGRGLLKAGEAEERVVALCADLTGSTQMNHFAEKFPERFFEVGIAEQNLVTVASGLAAMDKVPFTSSYAAFSPGRNWEQIRTTVCLNERPVVIVGSHAGLYTGPDGATHQMLEDIALMRVLPNMTVIVPGDSLEAERATLAIAASGKPAYLRLARDASPVLTTDKTPFEIGKAYVYRQGKDISLMTTGVMTYHALVAAEKLQKDGIDAEVVHIPSIKPFDAITVIRSAKRTGKVLVAEEAQVAGGLGSLVAETLSEAHPVPVRRLGVHDVFGESGTPQELLQKHGLTADNIRLQVHAILSD